MCYGRNLATMDMVDMGEAVGILAAQSIGEPGTQLTLRTFHIGGTSIRIAEEAERRARADGVVHYTKGLEWADVPVEFEDGTKAIQRVALTRDDESADDETKEGILVVDPKDHKRVLNRYPVPEGAILQVKEGDAVLKGDNERRASILYTWDPYYEPVASSSSTARCGGRTWSPASRSARSWTKAPASGRSWSPPIRSVNCTPRCWSTPPNRKDPQEYTLAEGSRIIFGSPTDQVSRAFDIPAEANPWSAKSFKVDERPINVAWPSRSKKESKDKTVWLSPRGQGEEGRHRHQDPARGLQDARHHRRPAAHRGAVRGPSPEGSGDDRGNRRRGEVRRDQARQARDLRLPGGRGRYAGASRRCTKCRPASTSGCTRATACAPATASPKGRSIPHDILRIKGPRAVQEYLLNEVQEVYRLQGVRINDKHIGVIVRQMLQKVRVTDPGDTDFLEGETVDKLTFREENERVVKRKGDAAEAEPVLLGITKA